MSESGWVDGCGEKKIVVSYSLLFSLTDQIQRVIQKLGWSELTPIQATGLPIALSGRDVVGIAQTGSGKTAAVSVIHIKQ